MRRHELGSLVVSSRRPGCLNGCYIVCGCGTEYRCGALLDVTCGDMLEAMARITPSQPNDAMARIAPRRNRTILLDPNLPGQISEKIFRDSLDVNLRFRSKKTGTTSQSRRSRNFTFSLAAVSAGPPCSAASFEVNSEPHSGARPSVRLCVGLIIFEGRQLIFY